MASLVKSHSHSKGVPLFQIAIHVESLHILYHLVIILGVWKRKFIHFVIHAAFFILILFEVCCVCKAGNPPQGSIKNTARIVTYHHVRCHQQTLHILIVRYIDHIRILFHTALGTQSQIGMEPDKHRPFSPELFCQHSFQPRHIQVIDFHIDILPLFESKSPCRRIEQHLVVHRNTKLPTSPRTILRIILHKNIVLRIAAFPDRPMKLECPAIDNRDMVRIRDIHVSQRCPF